MKSSPVKEKLTSIGDDNTFRLPPLKNSPGRIKSVSSKVMNFNIVRSQSGSYSPAKPTTVPVLPLIKRNSIKRQSFGITNRSCEISFNVEHYDDN